MMPIFRLHSFLSLLYIFGCCCLVPPQLKFQKFLGLTIQRGGLDSARSLNYTFMIVVINISRTLTSVSISQHSRGPVGLEGKKKKKTTKIIPGHFVSFFSFNIYPLCRTQQLFIVISYVSPSDDATRKGKKSCCSS